VYRTPINFHKRLMRGESPITYVIVRTPLGYRAYGEKELAQVFGSLRLLADGSVVAGGDEVAGSDTLQTDMASKSARITGFGYFERTIQSMNTDLLTAFTTKQRQHISIPVDDTDGYFTRLMAKEPFLGGSLQVFVGFERTPQSEHLNIFTGAISEIEKNGDGTMIWEADER